MLEHRGVTQSKSRKGNCLDNAVIESFFGTLKAENFYVATLNGVLYLEAGVHNYIYYYNHERIKLGLQGLSPVRIPAEKHSLIGRITISNFWGSVQT